MSREKAMEAANLIADEMITYEVLLKDLRDAKNVDRGYHLDKIERFVAIMNIRANKALPKGWEML